MNIPIKMTVASSARQEITNLLSTCEEGSVVSMLIGYYYDGDKKIPSVEIDTYSPEFLELQISRYERNGKNLLHDCDGIIVALVLTDTIEWLEGRTLVFADGIYQIRSH